MIAKKIKHIMIEKDISTKEVAERIGTSSSNISNKLRRDNFSEKEIREIAEALECDFDVIFTIRDTGKTI